MFSNLNNIFVVLIYSDHGVGYLYKNENLNIESYGYLQEF